jgi:hypothetical protein
LQACLASEHVVTPTPANVFGVVSLVVVVTVKYLAFLMRADNAGEGGIMMVLWFSTIAVLGAVHVARHPEILWPLSPVHGVRIFYRNGSRGFRVLGGVVVSVTGGESLYADMGTSVAERSARRGSASCSRRSSSATSGKARRCSTIRPARRGLSTRSSRAVPGSTRPSRSRAPRR